MNTKRPILKLNFKTILAPLQKKLEIYIPDNEVKTTWNKEENSKSLTRAFFVNKSIYRLNILNLALFCIN